MSNTLGIYNSFIPELIRKQEQLKGKSRGTVSKSARDYCFDKTETSAKTGDE